MLAFGPWGWIFIRILFLIAWKMWLPKAVSISSFPLALYENWNVRPGCFSEVQSGRFNAVIHFTFIAANIVFRFCLSHIFIPWKAFSCVYQCSFLVYERFAVNMPWPQTTVLFKWLDFTNTTEFSSKFNFTTVYKI